MAVCATCEQPVEIAWLLIEDNPETQEGHAIPYYTHSDNPDRSCSTGMTRTS